ncbi:hypothetical protein CR205_17885 [Alteribacter lacisalsi]|uniref:G5 domain-containing protein n=1 Tax=Alteribacter lacisalsi TaxID=2045244 RepID=A0A2W0H819_9BACI|nr:peptidoglycan DD-metalloendopeptidase family protein [Alteribacter lacisalsi]PYZ96230.1 hypothetical protein CR205_17885 [Alteribacter lacisalsi]
MRDTNKQDFINTGKRRAALVFALVITALLFRGAETGVSAYQDESLETDRSKGAATIYHVMYDGELLGFTDDPEEAERKLEDTLDSAAEEYEDLTLVVSGELELIPERVFQVRTRNDVTLHNLEQQIDIKAEATAVFAGGEKAGYTHAGLEPKDVKRELLGSLVSQEAVDAYMENDESSPEPGEVRLDRVQFSQDIETRQEIADPERIITGEDLSERMMEDRETAENAALWTGEELKGNASGEIMQDTEKQTSRKKTAPFMQIEIEKRTKTVSSVPYETKTETDSSMTEGTTEVSQQGEDGERVEEKQIVMVNGEITDSSMINEEVTEEPEDRIVVEGTAPAADELEWPAVGGYISSYQGPRWGSYHKGIDIARPSSHEILAAHGGTVTSAQYENGYGNTVRIENSSGMETVYAHLDSMGVSKGDSVSRGDELGIMGETGTATGVHVHFEVYEDGELKDPMDYLDEK